MKPPIGIMPKRFYEIAVKDEGNKNDYLRFIDLRDAIKRYKDAEFNVPTEWYDELNDLNKGLREEKLKRIFLKQNY